MGGRRLSCQELWDDFAFPRWRAGVFNCACCQRLEKSGDQTSSAYAGRIGPNGSIVFSRKPLQTINGFDDRQTRPALLCSPPCSPSKKSRPGRGIVRCRESPQARPPDALFWPASTPGFLAFSQDLRSMRTRIKLSAHRPVILPPEDGSPQTSPSIGEEEIDRKKVITVWMQ